MLIDDVVSNEEMANHPEHPALMADLRQARVFSLSTPFAKAADDLRRLNPTSFGKILGLFKLPFPLCWLEVAQMDRHSFVESGVKPGTHGGVRRVGILLRQDKSCGPIEMDLFWSFSDGSVYCARHGMTFVADSNAIPDLAHRLALVAELRKRVCASQVEAALRLEQCFHQGISRYRRHEMQWEEKRRIGRRLEVMDSNSILDWGGEPDFWIAAVALMNSRNVYAERLIDHSGTNAARARKGRRPLFSMTECVLSERLIERMKETGTGRGETRSHFVRGHFKGRTSGIFWWSPFVRGDPGAGTVDKTYRVD